MGIPGTDSKTGITGINVTPLIDVLLVLLIIFMVIVPITARGLHASVPQPARGGSEQPGTVVVEVLAGPGGEYTYLLNQKSLAKAQLKGRLETIFAGREHRTIFVKADPSMEYSKVAEVIDMGHQADVDNIGLITPKIQAGQ